MGVMGGAGEGAGGGGGGGGEERKKGRKGEVGRGSRERRGWEEIFRSSRCQSSVAFLLYASQHGVVIKI